MQWLAQQFNVPPDSILIYGNYEPWLVVLSVMIAIFASFMALQVTGEARHLNTAFRRNLAFMAAGASLGGGVWSMHFIGMLAFSLCTDVRYGWELTVLSMAPSVLASWVALRLIDQDYIKPKQLILGGVLVGAGIGTMHYLGMAAMQMGPLLRYDQFIFSLSIIFAVTLAIVALWIRFGIKRVLGLNLTETHLNFFSAVVLGLAISGMHYIGMSAARFVTPLDFTPNANSDSFSELLAIGVAIITIIITFFVQGINLLMKYKDMSLAARASENRIKAIMDTAVDGIVTIDGKGKIIGANQAVTTILGWKNEELLNRNVRFLMPEPFRSEHDSYLQNYLETGIAKIIGIGRRVEALHKDGQSIPIRLAIGHTEFEGSNYFVAFITDITKRLEIERAVRENEEKYRSLISNIPGVAYRCYNTPEWPMLFISQAVEKVTGYPAEDFLLPSPKRSFADLFYEKDLHIIEAMDSNGAQYSHEYRIVRKDGSLRWILDTGQFIRDDEDSVVRLDGFLMDITDRRVMEEEIRNAKDLAEAAVQSRTEFLANMSHEIRTPMNSILGFSHVIAETELTKEQKSYLKSIESSAQSLLHLLNDILDTAKLEKGKVELEYSYFSLRDQLDIVVSTLWMQAKKKKLDLLLTIDEGLDDFFKGAPERIRQVMLNLIGNSIKFTETGSVRIDVKPARIAGNVLFSVTDTGIGIDKDRLLSIFEPFTQADASMTRRFGGTGLGTTISKQLIELMGGEIWATSELGVGSCFEFYLPLEASGPMCEIKTDFKASSPIELPPQNILIADDIQQNLDLLAIVLGKAGHKTTQVHDGLQAIAAHKAGEFDLILMDVQMPNLDGHSAAREIRMYELSKGLDSTPIIALTASVLESDKLEAKNSGMQGFAVKPINISDLTHEMARVLGIKLTNAEKPVSGDNPDLYLHKTINVEKGVNLWGSVDRFVKELDLFFGQWTERSKDLVRLLDEKQYDQLAQMAHSKKGVSGNLGLDSLFDAFDNLEAYAAQSNNQKCQDAITEVDSIFKLCVSQRSNIGHEASNVSSKAKTDHESLMKSLSIVTQLATGHEINENEMENLLRYCGNDYIDAVTEIIEMLDNFEFINAIPLLNSLQTQLQNEDSDHAIN